MCFRFVLVWNITQISHLNGSPAFKHLLSFLMLIVEQHTIPKIPTAGIIFSVLWKSSEAC